MLSQRGEDQSKLMTMNPYYTAAAAAAAAASNASMSPASAISLLQAAMTPPPALPGMPTLTADSVVLSLLADCTV